MWHSYSIIARLKSRALLHGLMLLAWPGVVPPASPVTRCSLYPPFAPAPSLLRYSPLSLSGSLYRTVRQGGDDALLAVRRAVRDLVDCPAAVCSVCVLLRNKEEHPPPGYRVIQKV